MNALTNVFQWFAERIHELWPIRIIDADEQGVKFSGGKHVTMLLPGLHFFLPKYQRIEKVNVKYQEVDCQTQALETLDDRSILLSVNVGYTIRDAVKWRTEVQSFDSTIERRVRGLIARAVLGMRWEDLRSAEALDKLCATVLSDLRRYGSKWGVKFHNVALTDLSRARPLRIFSS